MESDLTRVENQVPEPLPLVDEDEVLRATVLRNLQFLRSRPSLAVPYDAVELLKQEWDKVRREEQRINTRVQQMVHERRKALYKVQYMIANFANLIAPGQYPTDPDPDVPAQYIGIDVDPLP